MGGRGGGADPRRREGPRAHRGLLHGHAGDGARAGGTGGRESVTPVPATLAAPGGPLALGATPVLVGVLGEDVPGEGFLRLLGTHGLDRGPGLIADGTRRTTLKTPLLPP